MSAFQGAFRYFISFEVQDKLPVKCEIHRLKAEKVSLKEGKIAQVLLCATTSPPRVRFDEEAEHQ